MRLVAVVVALLSGCGLVLDPEAPRVRSSELPSSQRAFRFGGIFGDQGSDVAVDEDGNVYLTGFFSGEMTLGAQTVIAAGERDAFLVSFTPELRLRWLRTVGGSDTAAEGRAIAVDDELVVVTGSFAGDVIAADRPLASRGERDVFVVAFDRDGAAQWVRSFGGAYEDEAHAIDLGPSGVWVGGSFKDVLTGAGSLTSAGDADGFLVRLGRDDGAPGPGRAIGDSLIDSVQSISVDPETGRVAAGGRFMNTIDLGMGSLVDPEAEGGWLALFEADASTVWTDAFVGDGRQIITAVDIDARGAVWFGGYFQDALTSGLGTAVSAGSDDAFVGLTSGPGEGRLVPFGGEGSERVYDLSSSLDGTWIAGAFTAALPTVPPLQSAGLSDAFVATFGPDGSAGGFQRMGGENSDRAAAVAAARGTEAWVTGYVIGEVDFLDGPIASIEADDGFLTRVAQ